MTPDEVQAALDVLDGAVLDDPAVRDAVATLRAAVIAPPLPVAPSASPALTHTHELDGQTLTHSHVGGGEPHGYFDHEQDAPAPPTRPSPVETPSGDRAPIPDRLPLGVVLAEIDRGTYDDALPTLVTAASQRHDRVALDRIAPDRAADKADAVVEQLRGDIEQPPSAPEPPKSGKR